MSDSFFQAAVYLAAAVVCVPLATRLGLGSVLGYLITGVAIGPLKEKGQLDSATGRQSFAVLLFQDVLRALGPASGDHAWESEELRRGFGGSAGIKTS